MFLIRSPEDKLRAIDYIKQLAFSPVQQIKIGKYKKNRTKSQNDTFHMWTDIISDFTGYTEEEVKSKLVLSLWQPVTRVVTVKTKEGVISYPLTERRSTTSLSTEEMSQLMDATMMVAAELKLNLPLPDSYMDR